MENVAKKSVKEMSVEEIMALQKQLKELQGLVKDARKEGLIPKTAPKAKEVTPEIALLADSFKAILEANKELVVKLFDATKTADKPDGNIGVNIHIEGYDFDVQILSDSARKAQQARTKKEKEDAKAKEKAKAEEKRLREADPATLNEDDKAKLAVILQADKDAEAAKAAEKETEGEKPAETL